MRLRIKCSGRLSVFGAGLLDSTAIIRLSKRTLLRGVWGTEKIETAQTRVLWFADIARKRIRLKNVLNMACHNDECNGNFLHTRTGDKQQTPR
jgi:hypothetical protein